MLFKPNWKILNRSSVKTVSIEQIAEEQSMYSCTP